MALAAQKILIPLLGILGMLGLLLGTGKPLLTEAAFWLLAAVTVIHLYGYRFQRTKFPKPAKHRYEWLLVTLFFLIVASIATFGTLSQGGVIGGRHDWVLPADELRSYLTGGASAWSNANLGESKFFYPTYLLDLLVGLLGSFGMSGATLSKLVVFGVMVVAPITLYSFSRRLGASRLGALIGALLYATTPILYDKIVAGHVGYLIAYAIAPLFLAELVLLEQQPSRQTLARAVLTFVIASIQIQFAAMLTGFALIFALAGPNRRQVFRLIGFSLIALVGVHAPWLLAHLGSITSQAQQLARDAAVLQWIESLSSPLEATFRLGSEVLPYFLNQVKDFSWWQLLSGLLVSLILLTPTITRSRLASFFALTGLAGLFLAKGTSPPFTGFYIELFLKLPATALFREVNHWLFIPAISYSVLAGLLTTTVSERSRTLSRAVVVLAAAAMVAFGAPFWQGSLNSDLQTIAYPAADRELAAFLRKQTGRILFLPAHQKNRYPGKRYAGFDPLVQEFADRTFEQEGNVLAKTSPAHRVRNLILAKIYGKEPNGLTPLLARANVQRVVIRPQIADEFPLHTIAKDFPNREVSFDLKTAEQNLSSAGLVLEGQFGPNKVYLSPEQSSAFYLTQAPIPQEPQAFISVDPADFANRFFDPTRGFVKSYYLWWYNRQFVTIEDRAVHTQTDATLTIPFKVTQPGILYVRALTDPKGGDLGVSSDGRRINTLDLTGSPSRWQWFELGLLSRAETITFERLNGEVTVGRIALYPAKIDTQTEPPTLENLVLRDYQPLGYQIVGRTSYRLQVTTDRPRYLVFAESYDPGWVARLGAKTLTHERVGFANGFLIDQPGSHDIMVSFAPERFYWFGLVVAGFTLVLLTVASIKRQHHAKDRGRSRP